jgi:hypothetical protein
MNPFMVNQRNGQSTQTLNYAPLGHYNTNTQQPVSQNNNISGNGFPQFQPSNLNTQIGFNQPAFNSFIPSNTSNSNNTSSLFSEQPEGKKNYRTNYKR